MPLTFKEIAAASVPNAPTDHATMFLDTADGIWKSKDESGTVASLGTAGLTGDPGAPASPVTFVAHGNCGATETFDWGDGWVHTGTVDANLTVTLAWAGLASGDDAVMELLLIGDGSHDVTSWDGAIVWEGGSAPSFDTTLGAINRFLFETIDQGTTVTGVKTGPGPAGADGVPGLTWQGAWSAGTYAAGDAVSHSGSSYIANTTTSDEPPGSDWDLLADKGADGTASVGTDGIWDAAGDLVVGTGSDTASRLAVGADNTSLVVNASSHVPAWQHPVLTSSINQLGAPVSMTSANTPYDGPSLTLGVGIWFLDGNVTLKDASGSGGQEMTAKLWNGTTVIDSMQNTVAANFHAGFHLCGIVTIASGTETWKITALADTATNQILAAATTNGAGNNASTLVAIRIG